MNISPPLDVTGLHLNNLGNIIVIVIKNNIRHCNLPSVFIVVLIGVIVLICLEGVVDADGAEDDVTFWDSVL